MVPDVSWGAMHRNELIIVSQKFFLADTEVRAKGIRMTLQQLRYLIAVAERESINAAARDLYVSQSSLSVAVKELEEEFGVSIFNRSSKGITLTNDGIELLSYARQVVEQADLMLNHYDTVQIPERRRLSVSSQHYAFVVLAFIEFANAHQGDSYRFVLRETRTSEVINDVATFRADLGVLYLDTHNRHVIGKRLEDEGLSFTSLFCARPHVFVRSGHPLATLPKLSMKDLAPYPRLTFEQGPEGSLFYAEEPLSSLPHSKQIIASDRATLTSLLRHMDGFLVSSGVRSDEMFDGIMAMPLETDEVMEVGFVTHDMREPSDLAQAYLECLYRQILDSGGGIDPSSIVLARSASPSVQRAN